MCRCFLCFHDFNISSYSNTLPMIASLPMYLRPELVDAHNIYWALIYKHLKTHNINAPEGLSTPSDTYASWTDPGLVLSQTCGMPYRNSLHGKVQLVGTPDFNITGCAPGYYRSAVVVRQSDSDKALIDFKHSTFAFNSKDSQSGYAAAFSFFKKHGLWFNKQYRSEAHLASALAVAEGRADITAIDAVSWRLMLAYESFSEELHVIDWTEPTPGLPYITAMGIDKRKVFESVSAAIEELPTDTKHLLGIHGLIEIDAGEYLRVGNPDE